MNIPVLEFPNDDEASTYMANAIDAEYALCGLSMFERRLAPMPDAGSAVRMMLIAHLTQNGYTREASELMITNIPNEHLDQIIAELSTTIEPTAKLITIVLAMSNKIIAYWNSLPTAP